jgi:hypothetical protein
MVKTIISHPIFDGLYHPFMVIQWGWFIIVLTTTYVNILIYSGLFIIKVLLVF